MSTDNYGIAGKHGALVNGRLMDECDPFWIESQRKVKDQVRRYARRQKLGAAAHRELLDMLGLA